MLLTIAALRPKRFPDGAVTYDEILSLVKTRVSRSKGRGRHLPKPNSVRRRIQRIAKRIGKLMSITVTRSEQGFTIDSPVPVKLRLWVEAYGENLIDEELWKDFKAELPEAEAFEDNTIFLARISGFHAMLTKGRASEVAYLAWKDQDDFPDANSRAQLLYICGDALLHEARFRLNPEYYYYRARRVFGHLLNSPELCRQLEPALVARAMARREYCRAKWALARSPRTLEERFAYRRRLEAVAEEIEETSYLVTGSDLDSHLSLAEAMAEIYRRLERVALSAEDAVQYGLRAGRARARQEQLAISLRSTGTINFAFNRAENLFLARPLELMDTAALQRLHRQFVEISRSDLQFERDDTMGRALRRTGACLIELLRRGIAACDTSSLQSSLAATESVRQRLIALHQFDKYTPNVESFILEAEAFLAMKKRPAD